MAELVSLLSQTAIDKLPPRPPVRQGIARWRADRQSSARRPSAVFPDLLLVDSDLPGDTSAVYWYGSNGLVSRWTNRDAQAKRLSEQMFRTFARHARHCYWEEYVPRNLGGVAVTVSSERLESEAFFRRGYYDKWLRWIEDNRWRDGRARQLANWLAAEQIALEKFVDSLPKNEAPLEVLDLGCGSGRHLHSLATTRCITGVGIDVNELAINTAITDPDGGKPHAGELTFILGDVATLGDFDPQSFDAAICMTNTLGNLPRVKQRAMVRRVAAVLRPGGKVLFSVYNNESVDARLFSYRAIGLDVEERDDIIFAAEGLRSEDYSRAKLRTLLEQNDLHVESMVELNDLGVLAVATPSVAPAEKAIATGAVPA